MYQVLSISYTSTWYVFSRKMHVLSRNMLRRPALPNGRSKVHFRHYRGVHAAKSNTITPCLFFTCPIPSVLSMAPTCPPPSSSSSDPLRQDYAGQRGGDSLACAPNATTGPPGSPRAKRMRAARRGPCCRIVVANRRSWSF